MSKFRAPLVLGLGLCAALALAASPVGTWKGKLTLKLPPLPANATPQQKDGMAKIAAMMAKATFTLQLKADKTYSFTAANLPGGKNETDTGTWSQAGAAVSFKSKKPTDPVQKLTLSADGKTLTQLLPNGQGKIVFTK